MNRSGRSSGGVCSLRPVGAKRARERQKRRRRRSAAAADAAPHEIVRERKREQQFAVYPIADLVLILQFNRKTDKCRDRCREII